MAVLRACFAGVLLAVGLAGCGSPVTRTSTESTTPEPVKDETASAPFVPISVPFKRITGPLDGEAKTLVGKGGTFPAPLYKQWFTAYSNKIGVKIDYTGIGSSEGIKKLSNQEVDFAATDALMTDTELQAAKGGAVLHIPTAFGAVAIAYNVPGVTGSNGANGRLKFTPQTLSDIYQGVITRWNDPLLVRDNPQLATVHTDIIAVHRADGSGTTFGFTDYLSTVNPAWRLRSGKGTSVYWNEGIGALGSGGVAKMIRQNPNSIGYVELGYAQRSKLAYALIQNRAGPRRRLTRGNLRIDGFERRENLGDDAEVFEQEIEVHAGFPFVVSVEPEPTIGGVTLRDPICTGSVDETTAAIPAPGVGL